MQLNVNPSWKLADGVNKLSIEFQYGHGNRALTVGSLVTVSVITKNTLLFIWLTAATKSFQSIETGG